MIAGTGASSTDEAIRLTEYAKKAGFDMALSVGSPTAQQNRRRKVSIATSRRSPGLSNCPFLYSVSWPHGGPYVNDTIRLAQGAGHRRRQDATGNLDRACDLIARAPWGASPSTAAMT